MSSFCVWECVIGWETFLEPSCCGSKCSPAKCDSGGFVEEMGGILSWSRASTLSEISSCLESCRFLPIKLLKEDFPPRADGIIYITLWDVCGWHRFKGLPAVVSAGEASQDETLCIRKMLETRLASSQNREERTAGGPWRLTVLSLISLLCSENGLAVSCTVGGHFLSANLRQPHRGAWKQPPSSSTQRSAALTGRWSAVLLSGTDRETPANRGIAQRNTSLLKSTKCWTFGCLTLWSDRQKDQTKHIQMICSRCLIVRIRRLTTQNTTGPHLIDRVLIQ